MALPVVWHSSTYIPEGTGHQQEITKKEAEGSVRACNARAFIRKILLIYWTASFHKSQTTISSLKITELMRQKGDYLVVGLSAKTPVPYVQYIEYPPR